MQPSQSYLFKITTLAIVLIIASFFLFFNLGYYDLWDDEATTALFAQSVWATGDTYALLGNNLIAFNSGSELYNLYNRYMPPLQFYLAAPFVGIWGNSSLAARFPFACFGLLTIILVFIWLEKAKASKQLWILMSLGIIGNASLFLFFRQCRYFAPSIFFTTLLAYFYTFRKNSIQSNFCIIATALLLILSNYLIATAVFICILMDYILWGHRSHKILLKNSLIIISSIILCGTFFFLKYNILKTIVFPETNYLFSLKHRLILVYWNLRELNRCEFGSGLLLLISPLLYFIRKDKLLLRCPFAILLYCITVSLLSPQVSGPLQIAIVRYTVPLILICILTVCLTIKYLTLRFKYLSILLAIIIFGTNIFNGGPKSGSFYTYPNQQGYQSTILSYINELFHPTSQSYKIVSHWINTNLNKDTTIWITPAYACYPLMFHSPEMIYAWQLKKESKALSNLSPIHFFEKESPNIIIALGPYQAEALISIERLKKQGIHYNRITQINTFWGDLTRPELYFHAFKDVQNYNKDYQSVFIYKKVPNKNPDESISNQTTFSLKSLNSINK